MSKNDDLVRPIVGIENRTAQEVFDIMADRFRIRDAIERGAAQGVRELAEQVLEFFATARRDGLYIGAGKDLRRPDTEDAQYGPLAKTLLEQARVVASTPPAPAPDVGELTSPFELEGGSARMTTPQPPAVEAEAVERRSMVETFGGTAMMPREDGEWVRFTDHEATLKAKIDEIERLRRECDHWLGQARSNLKAGQDCLEKLEAAEASNKALREKVEKVIEDMPESYYRTQLAAALRALRGEGGVDG